MSPTEASAASAGAWPPSRQSRRGKLRNGTFVIPSTGERSRRQFTLRTSSSIAGERATAAPRRSSVAVTTDRLRSTALATKAKTVAAWNWFKSRDGRQVLKCTLAYLLGSTATFWSPLSDFLGHRDGKHIVATLTVYFHPARTMGSMLEAILIAIAAVAYAEIVCVLSMAAAIASRNSFGSVAPAHAVVLIVFVGGGLGLIGWVKQRMNQPLVNVASTLASMAIISVITKEQSIQDGYFSGDKIMQVIKMLILGILFSVAVNMLVWPLSARRILRESIATASRCTSDRLSLITRGFLNGTEDEVNSSEYTRVRNQYNAAYAHMSKSLREAKMEHYFLGREAVYKLDKRLFKSVEALYRAIGGLRGSLTTQIALLRETGPVLDQREPLLATSDAAVPSSPLFKRSASSFLGDEVESLSIIEEADEDPRTNLMSQSEPALGSTPVLRTPSDIFNLFMTMLGPSMKSLAYTLSETLREHPFGANPVSEIAINDQLRESLRDAVNLYNHARGNALHELYRSIEMGRSRSEQIQADIEEVAAACGHFSFSLQAVADEMDSYLDVLEELKHVTETSGRSWEWLKFWRRKPQSEANASDDPACETLLPKKDTVRGLKKSAMPKGIPDSMRRRRDSFHWDAAPEANSVQRSISQWLLQALRVFTRDDIRFGIKVGIGAILWAQFAFIPETRPMYQHWRGEWGLLSYMVVVGMTTGASNTTSMARVIGTTVGAACACLAWLGSQGNAIALALFGWFMALWNFYMILVLKNGPLGRIALLAYNVIVLYAYSLSQDVDDDDDDEGGKNPLIFDITYHRVVAVVLGILWGMAVCRLLWPISGRKKFREGLAVLYLQLGLIWKRGPLGVIIASNNTADYMREGEQAALQRYEFKLEWLCDSAKSEFELRGPFPHEAYGRILHSTKHILDGFYAMRLLTQRHVTVSPGERSLLVFTASERIRLCQRICHVFQVLASCIMLEYPLTDAIPTIDSTKDQLLGKVYQFRKEHMAEHDQNEGHIAAEMTQEKDYALVYAYLLVTTQVAVELRRVQDEIEGLFGVLNPDELLLE